MAKGLAEAQAALEELDRIGDDDGAIWALRVIGSLVGWLGRQREAQAYWRRAIERGGQRRQPLRQRRARVDVAGRLVGADSGRGGA